MLPPVDGGIEACARGTGGGHCTLPLVIRSGELAPSNIANIFANTNGSAPHWEACVLFSSILVGRFKKLENKVNR